MLDTQAQQDERQGNARQASDLVEREAEADRTGAFLANGLTDGVALPTTPRVTAVKKGG
jgi:hypothetical protein